MAENGTRMPNVTLENVRLLFRNFSGKEGQYNREGDRNFNIALDPEVAEDMIRDGWNVKFLRPREEGDEPQAIIDVAVKYSEKARPPQITIISDGKRQNLSEDEIEILDWAHIIKADVMIRPYQWNVNGNSGVKAYLQKLFVTIEVDELDRKYSDLPVAGATHNEYTDDTPFD